MGRPGSKPPRERPLTKALRLAGELTERWPELKVEVRRIEAMDGVQLVSAIKRGGVEDPEQLTAAAAMVEARRRAELKDGKTAIRLCALAVRIAALDDDRRRQARRARRRTGRPSYLNG